MSDQLDPQQKHLLRVEEMQRVDWLIGSGTSKFVARQVVSLMKNEKQNQNLLLKVDPALLFATTFFNPQQMFLLRVKLITQGEKRETSTKTCNETMLRDKLRVFVSRISPPLVTSAAYTHGQIVDAELANQSARFALVML